MTSLQRQHQGGQLQGGQLQGGQLQGGQLQGGQLQGGQHQRSEHQRSGHPGSDAEALSYLKDTGWTSRMATPSPAVHLAGCALLLGTGAWAAIALARHSLVAGSAVGVVAAALGLLDLLPALWTLTHRQYTGRYLAARVLYGNGQPRLHPGLTLLSLPALAFVAAAATAAHQSSTARLAWGLLGFAVALAFGLLRMAKAWRSA